MKYIVILLLLFFSVNYAQSIKQVKVYLDNNAAVQRLITSGADLEHCEYTSDNAVILFVSGEEYLMIKNTGIRMDILIDDWIAYYENLPKLSLSERESVIEESRQLFNVDGFGFGSMGGFYTYAEIGANLDSMYAHYPNLITQKAIIGNTHLGRPIWAVKISDNPNVSENEPRAGFDALIHAREPASMSTLMYFMWYLLENYGTNPDVTYLVDNREIFCIPIFNPDGYEQNRSTNPNGGGGWRKNRRDNSGSYGVDLNRNFSYKWGYDNSGSSPTPSSDTYRGPSAISEPETQAVTNFIIGKNIKTYLNMHAYQNAFLYPWGYIDSECPDFLTYREYCTDMTALNNFEYGTGSAILGYNSNGASRDWYYGEQTVKNKMYGYTMEIGSSSDGFWPSQSRIFPIAQINLRSLMYNAWVAGEFLTLQKILYNKSYFRPGDTVAAAPVYRNKGQSTSQQSLTIETTLLSPFATLIDGGSWLDSIPTMQQGTALFPVGFKISPTAPINEKISYVLTVKYLGQVMRKDTVSLYTGVPTYTFVDTTNNPLTLWTVAASPTSAPKWEATETTFYSTPNSYTDSKTGNYVNNSTITMTLTNQFALNTPSTPFLTFWTKHDLDGGYDYGQVEISINNGSTWTPLSGLLTKPGSGPFQPANQPLFSAVRGEWTREEISLGAYNNSSIKLRFKLRSNGSIVRDGWYVDDIGISYFSSVPVELVSFTADISGSDVTLRWETASELNNRGFEVQRLDKTSSNGWRVIGFIQGKGTTAERTSYVYSEKIPSGSIMYRLKQVDFDGSFRYYYSTELNPAAVTSYSLEQNYPNPFNPVTVIKYQIPFEGNVSLKVFDALGNEVTTLVNENKAAGTYEVELNGVNLSSGVYFYRLQSGQYTSIKKLALLK